MKYKCFLARVHYIIDIVLTLVLVLFTLRLYSIFQL